MGLLRRLAPAPTAMTGLAVLLASALCTPVRAFDVPPVLRTGVAFHAFDHLGGFARQADAAADCGMTIIYATGLGGAGYMGLPAPDKLAALERDELAYANKARARGIRLVLGYVCATSIVGLETFDRDWSPEMRARFRTPPAQWLQQDRSGVPLPSWYGGAYRPACMNNPDWRTYEKYIVRLQLESGHDGIFFDNPTVHPQGCYCPHCMAKFAAFLSGEHVAVPDRSLPALRALAATRSADFARFRCGIARDFLQDIRTYARGLRPGALITANNSLNSPDALYSQCQGYGYDIFEMSQAEDFVVVEDEATQPRVLANGSMLEYGPTYKQLHAISHGRPIVAIAIADGDYHTAPNLVRLALAEAAANDASYLAWPTWPENQRARMSAAIRPEIDLLRQNASLLQHTRPRREATLFLPFRRWQQTPVCVASRLAATLVRSGIQFDVVSEADLTPGRLRGTRVLLAESNSVFTPAERGVVSGFARAGGHAFAADESPTWLRDVRHAAGPAAVTVTGPPTVRAYVLDQPGRTIVHLLNLNVRRLSSFDDVVTPATGLSVRVRVPFAGVRAVRALSADDGASRGDLAFDVAPVRGGAVISVRVPRLDVSTILLIDS